MINSRWNFSNKHYEVNSFWCVRDKGKFAIVIYYTHHTSVRFEHSLYRESLMATYISVSLFIYLSVYLSIYLSIYIFLSIYLSIYLSIDLSICRSIDRSSHNQFTFPSVTVAKVPLIWSFENVEIYVKVLRSATKCKM